MWPLPNRVGFAEQISDKLASAEAETDGVFKHQAVVRDFLQPSAPYRGLLVMHALGAGKTLTAITVAEALRAAGRPVVVLLPASLKLNFSEEVGRFGGQEAEYSFIHYNGLTRGTLPTSSSLAGKTVIIDEAHNFCATSTKPNTLIAALYDVLMTAPDLRLVLLSGTPVINTPFELSRMMNLLRGPIRVFRLSVDDPAGAARELRAHPDVDAAWLDGADLKVTLLPPGFERVDATRVQRRAGDESSSIQRVADAVHATRPPTSTTELCLPSVETEFIERFVDWENDRMLDPELFMRRIQGLVSFFGKYDASIYPAVNPTQTVMLPMTEPQFNVYRKARDYEIKLERAAAIRRQSTTNFDADSAAGVYKAFSRAACNFAFPPEVARPYPKNARSGDVAYEDMIDVALDKLDLSMKSVSAQAPKFVAVRERATAAPGPVLVYTDFRKVEGVGLFSRFLLANGWTQLTLSRDAASGTWSVGRGDKKKPAFMQWDSNESKDHNSILRNIFNSSFDLLPPEVAAAFQGQDNLHGAVVKMLIVTKSATEGISLANTRQVHIMEPYWNSVRIEQITGRAVRAYSHARLPPKERQVDVFMYMMELTAEQQEDHNLKTFDRGMSTDQAVFATAEKKKKIITQFLDCLRRAAVDCAVHDEVGCYAFPAQLAPSALGAPVAFRDDVGNAQYAQRAVLAARTRLALSAERIKHKGRVLGVMSSPEGVLIDATAYKRMKRLVPMGMMRGQKKTVDVSAEAVAAATEALFPSA